MVERRIAAGAPLGAAAVAIGFAADAVAPDMEPERVEQHAAAP